MTLIEIPLLRESKTFVRRLINASKTFGESRYYFHRRVNWSYRYSNVFYCQESSLFQSGAESYVLGDVAVAPQLDDVYHRPLSGKQIITAVGKVLAHTLFAWLGAFSVKRMRHEGVRIYRKAYVDDIELVYDPEEASVVRAVYPFPINLSRQWRYLRYLFNRDYRFKLAGYPYGLGDFCSFLYRRDVHSLMRMESRAQIRHAREVASLGIHLVQLSDEFDIGSLDFARSLLRYPIVVVNSAHGVGKYFPVHAYQTFYVLTRRQSDYYFSVRHCNYKIRQLNSINTLIKDRRYADRFVLQSTPAVCLVFLGQVFAGVSPIVAESEEKLSYLLASTFGTDSQVRLLYKPHPNAGIVEPPYKFEQVLTLDLINGRSNTLFVSFFSTCQIDPSFKGKKILVRSDLIFPEIAFDTTEPIYKPADLLAYIQTLVDESTRSVSL